MSTLETLRAKVGGPVLLPGDQDYDAERGGFQLAGQHRPDVIVGALDAQDVRAAVEYAAANNLPVAVQNTGHGLPQGADGGLLISTRRMTGLRIDPERGTAWIEAGVQGGQLVQEAAKYGLAPLNGSAPTVGAVSYALGGGVALMARTYGFAADHVGAMEVVTADARLRTVTPDSDPDLFWALLGGRANFGVVTGLEIGLVPVTRIYGGGLYFDAALFPEILETYRSWTATVPGEMTSSIALMPIPDIPNKFPEPLRGRHVAHVRIVFTGDAETGERLIAPLRAAGDRLIDTVTEMPYAECATVYNEPAQPVGYASSNVLLTEIDSGALKQILELVGPGAQAPLIMEIRHLGGALSERPAIPNAIGNRNAQYFIGFLSRIDPAPGSDDPARPLRQRVLDIVAPWSAGQNVNFLYGANASPEQVRKAFDPAAYERLTRLKAAYDPTNLFRLNHNIPPAPTP